MLEQTAVRSYLVLIPWLASLALAACAGTSTNPGSGSAGAGGTPAGASGASGSVGTGGSGVTAGAGGAGRAGGSSVAGAGNAGGAGGLGDAGGAAAAGASGAGAPGAGGMTNSCTPQASCAGNTTCDCCLGPGPTQHCLCTTNCTTDADCIRMAPARPSCDLNPSNGIGICRDASFACCWGCK
ncbi:MAG TPA: hypothetical protein VIK01_11665 [Polyangiaceae bacterium]